MSETEKMIVTLEARTAEFERAIEERLKPALRKAIVDVACEFLDDFGDLAEIREERG